MVARKKNYLDRQKVIICRQSFVKNKIGLRIWRWTSSIAISLSQLLLVRIPDELIRRNLSYLGTHPTTMSVSVMLLLYAFLNMVLMAIIRPLWIFRKPSIFFFDKILPWSTTHLICCPKCIKERVESGNSAQTPREDQVQPAENSHRSSVQNSAQTPRKSQAQRTGGNQRNPEILSPETFQADRQNSEATEAFQAIILRSLAGASGSQNRRANPATNFPSTGSSKTPKTPSAPSTELSNIAGDSNECSICNERPRDAVILNCGHSLCQVCGQELRRTGATCPWDRRPIVNIIPVYNS